MQQVQHHCLIRSSRQEHHHPIRLSYQGSWQPTESEDIWALLVVAFPQLGTAQLLLPMHPAVL